MFASVARKDTPGCTLDVRRGGKILAQRSYGMANLETPQPNGLDTVFEAGSVSKQLTGALAARLIERGTLSFDDSIRRWLPELPALYQPVMLGMLLHHTSGIRDWGVLADLTGWPRGSRAYSMEDAIALIAQQKAFNFPPGTEFLYSNSNYLLMARIIERAAGQPFAEFAAAELFTPLGMTQTRWRSDFRPVVPRRAQAYSPDANGAWQLDMPFEDVVGPGGLLTTVGDLQRWNAALDEPRRGWVALMTEPGRLTDGTRVPYGLGIELGPVAGRDAFSHAGSTAGYRAWLGRFPADHLWIALLCNSGSINTEELGPQLASLFLPAATPKQNATAQVATATGVPADVPGAYRNLATDTMVKIVEAESGLRIGSSRFLIISPDDFAAEDGRRARVSRDSGGHVSALVVTRSGNAPIWLEPTRTSNPDAAELAQLAGCYRSHDTDGEHCLVFADGALRWRSPRGTSQPLQPTIADTFSAPESGWTLRIRRDAKGAGAGFSASIGRARQIPFERQQATVR
ncbi:serine hydrolase domain-containing protein [Sphingomonas sp. HF-S4]|uniref:Serine hydrolase domain-containing protein n=1 Tax=Sphingomonas agrestis TaxID=3080540 RepID=A0ABU3Y1U5_9SPHN|nr:serine hydrolase domain-containing protein [Sphingomonas sp. HF-S4]MDV3455349.1 serine hydrolase domain-containing protein [Sphingomonas sp. HF-S4]